MPRFEADEFTAALVAGAKTILCSRDIQGGGVSLLDTPFDYCDVEYRYVTYAQNGELHVYAYTANCRNVGKEKEDLFFSGDFTTFQPEYEDDKKRPGVA